MVWVDKQKKWKRYADIVGLVHFVGANIIMVIAKPSGLFDTLKGDNPGITFMYDYIDAPIAKIVWVDELIRDTTGNFVASLAVAEFVFVACSILYAALTYVLFAVVFRFIFD